MLDIIQRKVVATAGGHALHSSSRLVRVASATEQRGDEAGLPMAMTDEGSEGSYTYDEEDEEEVNVMASNHPAPAAAAAAAAAGDPRSSRTREPPVRSPPPPPPSAPGAEKAKASAAPAAAKAAVKAPAKAKTAPPAPAAAKADAKAKAKAKMVAVKGSVAKAPKAVTAPGPTPPKAEVIVRPAKPATPPPGVSAMVDIDSDHSSDEEVGPPAGVQQAPVPKSSSDAPEGSAAEVADALREALPDDQRWEQDLGCSPPSSPAAEEEEALAADGYDDGGPDANAVESTASPVEGSCVDVEALKERMATLKEQLRGKLN